MAYPWDSNKTHISKINLPGDSTDYWIKDYEAREAIDKLNSATRLLGVTSTEVHDGDTQVETPWVDIDNTIYAVNPEAGQLQLESGDIIIYTGEAQDETDEGTEFVVIITKGISSNTAKWYKFGSARLEELGDLAYKNSVSGTTDLSSLNATQIAVTFGSSPVTDAAGVSATAIKTITSVATSDVYVPTEIYYDKLTSATVTVNQSAEFTGQIPIDSVVTAITGGTATYYTSNISLAFASGNTGTDLVYSVNSQAAVTGSVTVGSTSVYGVSSEATILATATLSASSASASTNITIASVDANETLIISALAFATSPVTVQPYTVGNYGQFAIDEGASAAIQVNTSKYTAVVPSTTFAKGVSAIVPTFDAVDISVTGSAVTDSSVSLSSTYYTATLATISDSVSIIGITSTSTVYGTVSAYAGGEHSHTFSGAN